MRILSRGLGTISKAGLLAASFGLFVSTPLSAAGPGIGYPQDQIYVITCPKTAPAGTTYYEVKLDLEHLLILESENDAGWEFEFQIHYDSWIEGIKGDAEGCGLTPGKWYPKFPISNFTRSGEYYYEFPLQRLFIVKNVPGNSVVGWKFGVWEEDMTDTDFGDVDPDPSSSWLYMKLDVAKGLVTNHNGIPLSVQIGKSKRIIGDGKGADFIAGLDFTIYRQLQTMADAAKIVVPGSTPKPKVDLTKPYDHVCRAYAIAAMNMSKEAVKLGCGFKPPIWSTEYQGHFDWCMHGENVLENANDIRLSELAKCKATAGTRAPNLPSPGVPILTPTDTCREYALEAVDMNRQAIKLGCGFNTPDWSNDHQAHFDWCISGDNISASPGETARHKAALAKCRASKPTPPPTPPLPTPNTQPTRDPACDLYANEALRLAAGASALGCGFVGPRWDQSYSAHYNFCTSGANPVILLAETAARDGEYRACQAKTGAATPAPAVGTDWVFADSHSRRLTQADLLGLSRSELWQARNEIFARKGLIFTTAKAKNFFGQKPWYQPVSTSVSLNAIEKANVTLIRSYE